MRKGRFTQIEIQKAIANDCLGVRAFFCLLLNVLINGNFLNERNDKEVKYKYFSYYFISLDRLFGLVQKNHFIKKRLDTLSEKLKKSFIFFDTNPTDIKLFLNGTFTYISILSNTLGLEFLKGNDIEITIPTESSYASNFEYEYQFLQDIHHAKNRISEYVNFYSKLLEKFNFNITEINCLNKYILEKVLKQKNYNLQDVSNYFNHTFEEKLKKKIEEIVDLCFDFYEMYYGVSTLLISQSSINKDEILPLYHFQYYFQMITINMPKHNGRTLLLKMIESIIDTLNMNFKSDFDSSLFKLDSDDATKEAYRKLLKDYYNEFYLILKEMGLIQNFTLKPDLKDYFSKLGVNISDLPSKTNNNAEFIYIPVLLEVSKSDYTSIPIQICLNAIHYLNKISVLNCQEYNEALQEVITLFNREFYLVNDSKMNNKRYYGSQANKRDDILSEILHKYLGYNDIKIIVLLDVLDDFNQYDEKNLEKILKRIEFKGIKLCIIKFDDYKGTQVKFASTKFVQMKQQNGNFPLYFCPEKVEKEKLLSYDVSVSELNFLDRLGNTKYKSLESVENYFYGKKIIYIQETVPVITKYEINQFYEDLLDINSVVADLHNIISTNQKTKYFGGYSIGVFGNFGSGKSSLINILFSLLQSKNRLNTEIPHYESTYKLTLSDYSSESIVEEIYLQIEKTIIEEKISQKNFKPRPYMIRIQFKILCKKVSLFIKKHIHIRYEKNRIENDFYIKKLKPSSKEEFSVIDNEIDNFLNSFESYTKKKVIKVLKKRFKKYKKTEPKELNSSQIYKGLIISEGFFWKKKISNYLKIAKKDLVAIKKEQKKIAKELKKQNVEASIPVPPKVLKKAQGALKKQINKHINCNKEIETAQEIEDHANLIKKRKQYKTWAFFWFFIAAGLWIAFICCFHLENNIFKENIFNVIPILAALPSFIASYYLYQGVRTRQTNFLSQNKIAVFHIEKLLEYSKVLFFKDNKKEYKKLRKIDPNFSSYPLNTIIMIDNLDRISNERVGNVLQGIAFINNEIKNSNLTFIIPISYEKFNENTYFLNEGYTIDGKQNINYTYKNPEMDMPFVMSNVYLNKIFDYKVYIPILSQKKFDRFISNVLNKAIHRNFFPIGKEHFLKLEEFLRTYFYKRKTKNLRDVANILNDVFSHLSLIYIKTSELELYFSILMILILCDVRYQFTEFIEELILENGFMNHFLKEVFKTNIEIEKIVFNQSNYSEAFCRKFLYSVEGKRYANYFKEAVNLFGKEIAENNYANKKHLENIGKTFGERVPLEEM